MRFEELTSECAVLVHRHMEKKQNASLILRK